MNERESAVRIILNAGQKFVSSTLLLQSLFNRARRFSVCRQIFQRAPVVGPLFIYVQTSHLRATVPESAC